MRPVADRALRLIRGFRIPLAAVLVGLAPVSALAAPLSLAVETAEAVRHPSIDATVLDIKLTPDGATTFADFTAAHVGEAIELRIDGAVVLTATLREAITSGTIEISGEQTADELRAIAKRIAAGARVEVDLAGN